MKAARPLRIELIERSMGCFALSFFSILPFLGVPLAALVLARNWQIKRRARGEWNPAARYLHWACGIAAWGAALSLLASITVGMLVAISQVGG